MSGIPNLILNRGKGKSTKDFKDKTMGRLSRFLGRKKDDDIIDQLNEVIRDLRINENSIVRDLMDDFYSEFGGFLRVYTNERATRLADEHELINCFRTPGSHFKPRNVMVLTLNITVGEFCDRMYEDFGLTVEVATRDNRVLIRPEIPLGCIQDIRNKADMDKILSEVL